MLKKSLTAILLSLCLSAGNCQNPGDFCDVVRGPIEFENEATVAAVIKTDRETVAEPLKVQNDYGRANCPAWR